MKKDYHFTVTDNSARCEVCGKPIKVRLVILKKPHNLTKCYRCYKKNRRLGMSHRNALRYI